MNWVCESCGYENEYNDESQPTECLCCGEPASEHLINQARRALEKYHKEQERQRIIEKLRQEAIKRQEKIEHSINVFIKGVKGVAAACLVVMMLAIAITGFSVYKGNISPEYIGANIQSTSIIDNMKISADAISEHLSGNAMEFKGNIIQNISLTTNSNDYFVMANLGLLVNEKQTTMESVARNAKQLVDDCEVGYENKTKNIVIPENNIIGGLENFTKNCTLFWEQATSNVNQLVDYISMKIGRSK